MITLDTNSPSKQAILKMMQRESSGEDIEMENTMNGTNTKRDAKNNKENNVDGIPTNNTEPKRVKVYVLEENEWKDTGTGFCMGKIETTKVENTNTANDDKNNDHDSETTQTKETAYLIVSNEESPGQSLLESKLEGSIEYQRQEETLIVWKDVNGHDIALSFEESIGCDTICNFIVQVQHTIARTISLVAVKSSDGGMGSVHEIIAGPVSLPSINKIQDTSSLMEALRILNGNTVYDYLKNETIEFVLKNKYINILINYFHVAEETNNLKDLLLLSSIMKTLILYNNREIIEMMVDDQHIMGIIGILEYDTEFPTMKANHRSYLEKSGPVFKELFPSENNDLKDIVKKCFRLQFLKDVVLVRFFDDGNINLILDIILDFETCIINFLQNDSLLLNVMDLYEPSEKKSQNTLIANMDQSELNEKKRDGIKLLHQCVQMSKNIDLVDKTKFYKYLLQHDLFNVLQYAFNVETDSDIRIMATDMIITIIEHDILLIQNVQHEKINNKDESDSNEINNTTNQTEDMKLLSILSTILLTDKSPGLREQVVQALNTLLHPDGCLTGNGEGEYDSDGMLSRFNPSTVMEDNYDEEQKWFNPTMDMAREIDMNDAQLNRYFKNFYDQIAPKLFAPLMNSGKNLGDYDDYLLIHLIKLLSFVLTEHNRIMARKFVLENGVLDTVSQLINPNHNLQLRLTSLRAIKNIIPSRDKFYYRYMISNNLFDPIFVLLKENIKKDNLANSSVQDFLKLASLYNSVSIPSNDEKTDTNINTNDIKLKAHNILLKNYLRERFKDVLEELDVSVAKAILQTTSDQGEDTLIKEDKDAVNDEDLSENKNIDKIPSSPINDDDQNLPVAEDDSGMNKNGKRVFSQV